MIPEKYLEKIELYSAEQIAARLKPILGKRKHESEYITCESIVAAADHFKCHRETVSNIVNKWRVGQDFDFKFA